MVISALKIKDINGKQIYKFLSL